MNDYHQFFKDFTDFSPYEFQEKIADAIFKGKNIILRAPTGSGKTWGTHIPFLFSKVNESIPVADKLIHILPLRILVNDLFDKYKSLVGNDEYIKLPSNGPRMNVTDDLSLNYNDYKKNNLNVSIQTGEYPGDKYLEGDIIFATYDQILASYLEVPLSLSQRTANINRGTLIGSLLIIDEFHLYDRSRSFKTTLAMLERLSDFCQVVIMTATMSDSMVQFLQDKINGVKITVPKRPSDATSNRKYKFISKELTFETLKRTLEKREEIEFNTNNKQIIIVLNTVNKAQELFARISNINQKTILLHSQLDPDIRKEREKVAVNSLGKDSPNEPCILITTQVIEVGVDITSDILITEIAPASSVVQRSGRCARFKGENGTVYIFDLGKYENGNLKYAPYSETVNKSSIDNLRQFLETPPNQAKDLGFKWEMDLINYCDKTIDVKFAQRYSSRFRDNLEEQISSDTSKEGRLYHKYIRSINSINVVISNDKNKDEILTEINQGKIPHTISVHRDKLHRYVKGKSDTLLGWKFVLKKSINYTQDEYGLAELSESDFKGEQFIILNENEFFYNKQIGLYLGQFGIQQQRNSQKVEFSSKDKHQSYSYDLETWIDHAYRTNIAVQSLIKKSNVALKKIIEHTNLEYNILIRLLRFTSLLHDLGKLQTSWQNVAKKSVDQEVGNIAHMPNKVGKLPPHSLPGAIIILFLIKDLPNLFSDISDDEANAWTKVVMYTIKTHHGSTSKSEDAINKLDKLSFVNSLEDEIKKVLNYLELNTTIEIPQKISNDKLIDLAGDIKDFFIDFENRNNKEIDTGILWSFFIRYLRFSDWNSFDVPNTFNDE